MSSTWTRRGNRSRRARELLSDSSRPDNSLKRKREDYANAPVARLERPLFHGFKRPIVQIRYLRSRNGRCFYGAIGSNIDAKSNGARCAFLAERFRVVGIDRIEDLQRSPAFDRVADASFRNRRRRNAGLWRRFAAFRLGANLFLELVQLALVDFAAGGLGFLAEPRKSSQLPFRLPPAWGGASHRHCCIAVIPGPFP